MSLLLKHLKNNALKGALLVSIAALMSGCFVFHDDYPSNSCTGNGDCFASQGEVCNQTTGKCEIGVDAAPEIDATPPADAPPIPDAGVLDAQVNDAAVNDAAVNDAAVFDAAP